VNSTPFQKTDKAFLNVKTNEMLSLLEVWSFVLSTHNAEAFTGVPLNWEWIEKTIAVRNEIKSMFRIVLNGERGLLHKLIFTAKVRHRMSPMPLVEAVTYNGGDDAATVVARWKGQDMDSNVFEIGMILRRDKE